MRLVQMYQYFSNIVLTNTIITFSDPLTTTMWTYLVSNYNHHFGKFYVQKVEVEHIVIQNVF